MPNPHKCKLVIHGGIFTRSTITKERHLEEKFHEALVSIVMPTFDVLCSVGARAAVLHGIRCLEDESLFNAGTGSSLQADGHVRMSAALMDSANRCFAGVINIEAVKNPIDVADLLAKETHTVLAGEHATHYARQHGFAVHNPITAMRQALFEHSVALPPPKMGTVGIVALDTDGVISAGTSTGGIGYEAPGRVGDSATVAGTYASNIAGVSCTGVGEHIVNHGVAVKIVTRVEDGMTLMSSVEKTVQEGKTLGYHFGLISLDAQGHVIVGKTLEDDYAVVYASFDGQTLKAFP